MLPGEGIAVNTIRQTGGLEHGAEHEEPQTELYSYLPEHRPSPFSIVS